MLVRYQLTSYKTLFSSDSKRQKKKMNTTLNSKIGKADTGFGWQNQFLGQGTQWPVCDRFDRDDKNKKANKTKTVEQIPFQMLIDGIMPVKFLRCGGTNMAARVMAYCLSCMEAVAREEEER